MAINKKAHALKIKNNIKAMVVDGVEYNVPQNIYRIGKSWRFRRGKVTKQYTDAVWGGTKNAFDKVVEFWTAHKPKQLGTKPEFRFKYWTDEKGKVNVWVMCDSPIVGKSGLIKYIGIQGRTLTEDRRLWAEAILTEKFNKLVADAEAKEKEEK